MSEAKITVDVAVIGAGSAGLVARRRALATGAQRVLLIEGGPYGTTCARVGCMPSKLLIAAADAAELVRKAATFGVGVGSLDIDGAAVMARVQRERDQFTDVAIRSTEDIDARDRLRGWARFGGPHTLIVETETGEVEVEAGAIVIATGSAPHIPGSLRELGDRLLTSDDIFELPTLPGALAVVGTGIIGLELGSAMHRLGVRTRIFDIGTRMPLLVSDAMQAEAHALFGARLDLQLGISNMQAERDTNDDDGDGVTLRWTDADGQAQVDHFTHVLAATGRRPQLARLELERAGVELDERGMPRDWDPQTTQIGELPLFVAGDATGTRPLLHEASATGRIAGANAARWPEVHSETRSVSLAIMFSEPNVAVVGEIPGADALGHTHELGEVDFGEQGRANIIDQAHGRARLYARRSDGRLVGAELIGPRVEHLAHLLAWAIEQQVTAARSLELPVYHPVIEEGLRTALAQLARRLRRT